jgi:hypothetical protein
LHHFGDDVGELGDVVLVARVGMRADRDPAVGGHDQAEPDESQVGPFLFGVAPLGDVGPVVDRIDVGGEVGHVQHQPGQVQPELGDHLVHQPTFDLNEGDGVDGVHGVPEATVIHGRGGDPHPAVPGRRHPPFREAEFRAWFHHTVGRGQSNVGPHRGGRVGAAGADDVVDDGRHPEAFQDRPHRGQVPEGEMTAAFGHRHRPVHGRLDIGRLAQVTLGDHLRLAAHPGHLPQVVVRLPAHGLVHDGCHTLCTTPPR